jgi:hypothetical protein
MDVFTRHRWTAGVIIALVLLNFFTLGLLWYREHRFDRTDFSKTLPHQRFKPELFLIRELEMTPEQVAQFKQHRKRFFDATRPHKIEVFRLKRKIVEEVFAAEPDAIRVRQWARTIGESEAELAIALFQHFVTLKATIRPEQHDRLRTVFEDLFRRLPPPGGAPLGSRPLTETPDPS